MARKRARNAAPLRRGFRSALLKIFVALAVFSGFVLIYLDASVTARFDGKKWAIPSKVYGRALELWPGAPISPQQLSIELDRLGYQRRTIADTPGSYVLGDARLSVHTRGFRFSDAEEPTRRLRISFDQRGITRIHDLAGREITLMRLEPPHIGGIYPSHNEDRLLIRLDEVPNSLIDALIAVEDRAYWSHHGISLRGILRAAWANLRSGQIEQGGSTLTQQLVKNFYLTAERSLLRKALEAVIAVLLELHYDKREILETYLNEIYLGQDGHRAIHGFGLASYYYFNRPISELDLEQQALLVALVRGPSYYDPWRHPQRALARRNLVLSSMLGSGVIDSSHLASLQQGALRVGETRHEGSNRQYPAYLDLVRRQLRRDYSAESLSSDGLQIFTPFDPVVQAAAEGALSETLATFDARSATGDSLEGAVIVIEPNSGEVKAIVGGRRARFAGFNRAIDAVRPIGSLIKPAVYLSALESGRYTLLSTIEDRKLHYVGEDGQIWEPRNFDKREHGRIALHDGLTHSYNLATAHLGLEIGVDKVLKTVRRLGVSRSLPELPAVLLGAANLSPLEVAGMYLTIASGGFNTPMRSIQEVLDARGRELSRYPFQVKREFDPQSLHLLLYNLIEVMREGTGRGAYARLPARFVAAGKSGTTDDLRDAWFAGFCGDLLAVVWIGRDDNKPTGLTGSSAALPVWTTLALRLGATSLQPVVPEGIRYVWVDPVSGQLSDEGCKGARYVPFRVGTEPQTRSDCVGDAGGIAGWWRQLFN